MKIVKISIVFILFLLFCNCQNEKRESVKTKSKTESSLVESQNEKVITE